MPKTPNHLTVSIASVPDRDEVVAELWEGDVQVGELAHVGGRLILQLYAGPRSSGWEFDYGEFVRAIGEMQHRLNR